MAKPTRATGPPPTLGTMSHDWFWLHCPSCGRHLAGLAAELAETYGRDTRVETIRRRERCEACGHRGALTYLPSWGDSQTGFVPYPNPTNSEIDAMCNLYSQTMPMDAVRDLFGVSHNRTQAVPPADAIFPARFAAVIRLAADGERELVPMSWGFVLPQPGKAPRRVTNTRDDKVLTSKFWNASFRQRRCLVPASSFCEPHGSRTPATWHWFALNGSTPRPLFAFAGIWQHHRGAIKKDGPILDIDTYSFMTSDPNELTATINHERSPVLLTTPDEWQTWMTGAPEQAFKLVRPVAADRLRIVQEGKEKHDLIAPVV